MPTTQVQPVYPKGLDFEQVWASFYVIEPSGEKFDIIPPNGKPKEW